MPLLWACSSSGPLKTAGLDTSASDAADIETPAWDTSTEIHSNDDAEAPREWGCSNGPNYNQADLAEPSVHAEGHHYRIVQIDTPTFDPFFVVVLSPPPAYRSLYSAGAPVIVTSMQSMGIGHAWATQPRSFFPLELGVVEVQPIHPGWTAEGNLTPGIHDSAGPQTSASLYEALRFAIGETETVDGLTLRDLVDREICTGKVAILAASSGGVTAATALDKYGEGIKDRLLGASFYETPSRPAFVLADTGFKSLDRWPTEDTDGNGVIWDEGRNPAFHGCDIETLLCHMDLTDLKWSSRATLEQVAPTEFEEGKPGLLYLDRNSNGQLDLSPDAHVDIDGNGLIGNNEDYFLLPHQDTQSTEYEIHRYSPLVSRAAEEVFKTTGWPTHLAQVAEAEEYWADRDATSAAVRAASHLRPDFKFVLAFSDEDHAVPVAERPHVAILYSALQQAGASVRTNSEWDSAACLIGEDALGDWEGGSDPGVVLDIPALTATAMPLSFPARTGRALATLGIFWDTWGPFDVCPHGVSSQ